MSRFSSTLGHPGAVALLVAAGTLGCKSDPDPAWAFDPIWVQPAGDDIRALQTWHLFRDRWHERRRERFYVCSVVVELEGTPKSPCPACALAWTVTPSVVEDDCAGDLGADALFLSLRAIGLGEPASGEGVPHAGQTRVGHADYGYGWEVHGWAYPDALDAGRAPDSPEWDGEQPFLFWPTAEWPLP